MAVKKKGSCFQECKNHITIVLIPNFETCVPYDPDHFHLQQNVQQIMFICVTITIKRLKNVTTMEQLIPTDTNIIQATVFWDVLPYSFVQYHMTLLPHLHSGNVTPTLNRETADSSKTLVRGRTQI